MYAFIKLYEVSWSSNKRFPPRDLVYILLFKKKKQINNNSNKKKKNKKNMPELK